MQRAVLRRSPGVLALTVFVLLVLGASVANAVDVVGALRISSDFGHTPPVPEEEARRNFQFEESNGFFPAREATFDPARELAVVLTGAGPEAPNQPEARIANGSLMPRTIVARTGATLHIQNTDPCVHNLVAAGHAELTGHEIAPGLTRTLTVNEAGTWPLSDEIYAHVTGQLHVIDDLVARATVQPDGSYRFSNVPAGTYTLKVFHLAEVVHTRESVVVEEGRELTIDPISLGGT